MDTLNYDPILGAYVVKKLQDYRCVHRSIISNGCYHHFNDVQHNGKLYIKSKYDHTVYCNYWACMNNFIFVFISSSCTSLIWNVNVWNLRHIYHTHNIIRNNNIGYASAYTHYNVEYCMCMLKCSIRLWQWIIYECTCMLKCVVPGCTKIKCYVALTFSTLWQALLNLVCTSQILA